MTLMMLLRRECGFKLKILYARHRTVMMIYMIPILEPSSLPIVVAQLDERVYCVGITAYYEGTKHN